MAVRSSLSSSRWYFLFFLPSIVVVVIAIAVAAVLAWNSNGGGQGLGGEGVGSSQRRTVTSWDNKKNSLFNLPVIRTSLSMLSSSSSSSSPSGEKTSKDDIENLLNRLVVTNTNMKGTTSRTTTTISTSSTTTSSLAGVSNIPSTIHVIVLVHGWMGNSLEMKYIQTSLQNRQQNIKQQREHQRRQNQQQQQQDDEDVSTMNFSSYDYDWIHVHSATCNDGQTFDGIAAGGRRLARETNILLQQISQAMELLIMQKTNKINNGIDNGSKQHSTNITLSFVGNSLGGLYSRFALSEINWSLDVTSSSSSKTTTSTTAIEIKPKLFVTTATPHLGVSQHTYLTLPRWMEVPIATAMQTTGRDLFRLPTTSSSTNIIIDDMAIQPKFVHPLRRFEQRIAYVNVYGTDFQVPTATAAFWDSNSKSIHYPITKENDDNNIDDDDDNIVLQLYTPQREYSPLLSEEQDGEGESDGTTMGTSSSSGVENISTKELSERLDSMGWTKILVNVRPYLLPIVPFTSTRIATSSSSSSLSTSTSSYYTAKQLYQEYHQNGKFTVLPLGHAIMVANSKDTFHQWMTKGGKVTMNSLATMMIGQLI